MGGREPVVPCNMGLSLVFPSGSEDRCAAHSAVVRIHALGRFGIEIRGQALIAIGKSQKRPLSLLQSVIARGGQAVSCVQLWESLWPDSDGDLAARNLTITLHRLRHLLAGNAAILHHEGKLSLNPRTCWVDVWQFERLVNDALASRDSHLRGPDWEARLREAMRLYQGHFLALEAEEAWMIEPRMRWKTRFERVASALTSYLECEGRFEEAIDVCLQAREIDPLNELLYRRAMNCYLKLGETASVARIYADCRDALGRGLAMEPSAETERLYRLASGPGLRMPECQIQAARPVAINRTSPGSAPLA